MRMKVDTFRVRNVKNKSTSQYSTFAVRKTVRGVKISGDFAEWLLAAN